jgi:hypothetical protein
LDNSRDEIVIRGSVTERDFIAFHIKNGLVTAVGIDRGPKMFGDQ